MNIKTKKEMIETMAETAHKTYDSGWSWGNLATAHQDLWRKAATAAGKAMLPYLAQLFAENNGIFNVGMVETALFVPGTIAERVTVRERPNGIFDVLTDGEVTFWNLNEVTAKAVADGLRYRLEKENQDVA
jgi:hypothetical protein